jgi:hypothetical protein
MADTMEMDTGTAIITGTTVITTATTIMATAITDRSDKNSH